MITM